MSKTINEQLKDTIEDVSSLKANTDGTNKTANMLDTSTYTRLFIVNFNGAYRGFNILFHLASDSAGNFAKTYSLTPRKNGTDANVSIKAFTCIPFNTLYDVEVIAVANTYTIEVYAKTSNTYDNLTVNILNHSSWISGTTYELDLETVVSTLPDGDQTVASYYEDGTVTAGDGYTLSNLTLRKNSFTKMVHLEISATSNSTMSAQTNYVIGTIPSGFRPSVSYIYTSGGTEKSYGAASVCITSAGVINVRPTVSCTQAGICVDYLGT